MKQIILVLFFHCLLAIQVRAQVPVTVSGVVQDSKTGEKLIGVVVSLKGTGTGAVTDFEGEFSLTTTQAFPLILVISYMGYTVQEIEVSGNRKPLSVKMAQQSRTLDEVQITDSRITEKQKQAPLSVETMDAIAIKQTPAANFYEGLSHLKGVDMVSASIGFKIINTRGFNSTSPVRSLQLIDGVDNQSPGLNFSLGNFLGSSELDVQKVDLIVGASSAYYGPNAFNGVISMQTKSPFSYPGLSASVKVGERSLFETAIRWAQVFKNKAGEDKFAYKLNIFYMTANDWEATNNEATSQSPFNKRNPGGYDAVNNYGDEYSNTRFRQSGLVYIGYGTIARKGYQEKDLVDYNSKNLKLNAALHYKIKKDIELIYASSFGSGTTIYQGDNRFSLKDILFFQNRLEVRKENSFYVRAYATNEDAGKSYDAYATALILQNAAKTDNNWAIDYAELWNSNIFDRMNTLRQDYFPIGSQPPGSVYETYANQYIYDHFYDSLVQWHNMIQGLANTTNPAAATRKGVPRYEPGTARFDSAFNAVTSKTNREGGSRFFDQSALYHIASEYKFNLSSFDFILGGNLRLYAPYSKGTIFLDTTEERIYNKEAGGFLGVERKFFKSKLKMSLTNRLDKNENFRLLWSPAITGVVVIKKHVFRVSASSGLRNPTLSDQYINLDVGRAILIGNLKGFDSLVSTASFLNALNSNNKSQLSNFNVDPLRPEQVQTIEMGYRAGFFKDKLYVDMSYYYSWYQHFIGYRIGVKVLWPGVYVDDYTVYRIAANAKDQVTTQGFTVGLNYFFKNYLGFNGNYSWNRLDRGNATDSIIPAFNTPEHKFNVGVNGRDINSKLGSMRIMHWGYSINYKHQTGFNYEGSPQFTGYVPEYGMVDMQLNKTVPKIHSTFKLGASNALDNRVYQVYGGPRVGRMIYASVLFELSGWK